MTKTLTAAEIKAEAERIWNELGVQQGANVTIWSLEGVNLFDRPGEARNPKLDAASLANIRKREAEYGPPPPARYNPKGPLPMNKETRQRYRERFPNNWRYLVANYGITEAKAKKERELVGLIDAEIVQDDKPAKPAKLATPAKKTGKRVTQRKIDAVAAILAKLERSQWAAFLAKWIGHDMAEKVAANDNLAEAAKAVLKAAYSA